MATERATRITDLVEAQMVECEQSTVDVDKEIEELRSCVSLDEWLQTSDIGRRAKLNALREIVNRRDESK